MDIFYIIAGCASIISLIISLIAIKKVYKISNDSNSKQKANVKKIENSTILVAGRNINK